MKMTVTSGNPPYKPNAVI